MEECSSGPVCSETRVTSHSDATGVEVTWADGGSGTGNLSVEGGVSATGGREKDESSESKREGMAACGGGGVKWKFMKNKSPN